MGDRIVFARGRRAEAERVHDHSRKIAAAETELLAFAIGVPNVQARVILIKARSPAPHIRISMD